MTASSLSLIEFRNRPTGNEGRTSVLQFCLENTANARPLRHTYKPTLSNPLEDEQT